MMSNFGHNIPQNMEAANCEEIGRLNNAKDAAMHAKKGVSDHARCGEHCWTQLRQLSLNFVSASDGFDPQKLPH